MLLPNAGLYNPDIRDKNSHLLEKETCKIFEPNQRVQHNFEVESRHVKLISNQADKAFHIRANNSSLAGLVYFPYSFSFYESPPRFKFECRKCLNCFQWHIPPNLLGGWYHKGIIWLLNSIFLACTPPQARILQIPSNGALNLNQILLSSLVL